jgi:phosphoribosylformylglycinamidine synthase
MNFSVLQFPASNCDQDAVHVLRNVLGHSARLLWHKEQSLGETDAVLVPGGFSYGDYLRTGAIARFSPVMQAVQTFAANGGPVLGICNGFQILCEAGLLPGALVRNRSLRFVCDMVTTRVEVDDSPFTHGCSKGTLLRLPVAHGEGCFFADAETLSELNANKQVILRYTDGKGRIVPDANPNGSIENIAGICNRDRNVFGLMPHPDRASDARLGSGDGAKIFRSMVQTIRASRSMGAPERVAQVA